MRTGTLLLLTAVIGPELASRACAQTPDSGTSAICFQGAPADRCTLFMVVEAGAHLRLTGHQPGEMPVLVNYALGFMVNSGARTAVGAEAFAGYENEIRGGVALRLRRWIGPRASLDFAAGVHLFGSANNKEEEECFTLSPGFVECGASSYSASVLSGSPMLQARLGYHDLVAVSTRLDVLRTAGMHLNCSSGACEYLRVSRTSTRLYLGAELGSRPGAAAQVLTAVAAAVVGLVLAATWDGPFGG